MDKKIPIYFDSVVISSPIQEIAGSNSIGRAKVRVFTKYGNRNGSYITDEVADQLIKSATEGMTPVVGFFDPSTKTWASHTGPTLANAYGYVEDFLGWEPFTDTDGETRDYAVFSVILFTKYFEEAKQILGQNQSMELDPESIAGDWALIEDNEYFVYTTAKMLGFCVIGSHEPCFSVSSFFSKNDDLYKSQYEKFSSLLFDLKAQVEEAEKGGEQPMDELENKEVVDPVSEEFSAQKEEVAEEFEQENEAEAETETEVEVQAEVEVEAEEVAPSEYEVLQQQYNDLQESYNQLKVDYENLQSELEQNKVEFETLKTQNEQYAASIAEYEAAAAQAIEEKKVALVEKYEKVISDEEKINEIKGLMKDFSYDELESKLAVIFANQQMVAAPEEEKIPLPEPAESTFALLMKKYRKN